jgi:hypothetical protein
MKRLASLALCAVAIAIGASACDDDDDPAGPELEEFVATLSAANEVPTNASTATGTVRMTVNTDQTISWTMDLAGINNLSASHIHGPAAAGVNASILANLFIPTVAVRGTLNGRVAAGTFGPSNLNGISMDSLLVLLRNGNAYVNIHTSDAALATNNTPGDLPAGEIRGQSARVP